MNYTIFECQCMTEKLIVITIELDYSKVPSKSTVPTYGDYKDAGSNPFLKMYQCATSVLMLLYSNAEIESV